MALPALQLVKIIDETIALLEAGNGSLTYRQELLAASKRLQAATETPPDTTLKLFWVYIEETICTVISTAIDMKLFDIFMELDEGEINAHDLAKKTKSDEMWIICIVRFLTISGFVNELNFGHFTSTPRTAMFATGSPLGNAIVHMGPHSQVLAQLPEYFRKLGDYKNPIEVHDGPFQIAIKIEATYFDWIEGIPEQKEAFSRHMTITRMEHGEISGNPDKPLLIDVSGGLGHDLKALKERYPSLPGQLIPQDLPAVIENVMS
ncbi:hypothetical protein EAF04_009308 [Stromatinia cepivora]|nr:hypothetical protein EAF04_009308 [Stromatinia cepivora]